jgi:hypothetical protein
VYDIEFSDDGADGHAFGLPPGIRPAQWPRSRLTGLPMSHLFTVHVPAEFRADRPDQVALSVFQTDYDDDIANWVTGVAEVFGGSAPAAGAVEPARLAAVTAYAADRHPTELYAVDEIACGWALIWLTAAEAAGPPCELPADFTQPARHEVYGSYPAQYIRQVDKPARRLTLVLRDGDPNAGRAMSGDPDYVRPHSARWRELGLPRFGSCHFGGTVDYVNGELPDFGPHYLEFSEWLGWPGLGGGNAQIDLPTGRVAWSC